ncbi:MAG: GGDEF domain-containing protein [Acholeplasmatales bacterium]|nr:GGDEF domain-containing protein [Acholeplasmatales bacterium]
MFDKEKKYKSIELKDMNGPMIVYSFKYGKIIDANNSAAGLFGFNKSSDFLDFYSYDLSLLTNKELFEEIEKNYDNGIYFFVKHFHKYINNEERHFDLVIDIQKNKEALYGFFTDVTDTYEENIKNEKNHVLQIQNLNIVLNTLVKLYASISKINLNTFESYQIISKSDKVENQKMTVDWNEYLEFFLMLIDQKSANEIRNICSKQGLKSLLNEDKQTYNFEFETSFDIATGERRADKKNMRYSLFVTIVYEGKTPCALVMMKNENIDFTVEGNNNNIINSLLVDYTSIFFIDYETLAIKLFSTNKAFSKILKTLSNATNYLELAKKYSDNFVYPEDRMNFLENTSIDNVKKILETRNSYIVNFRRMINYTVDKASLYFIKSVDEANKPRIILAIRTVYADELLSDATKDSLTGLLTYNSFEKSVSKIIKDDQNGYLIRFDIDRFTAFNNLFGLVEGDRLLQSIGDYLIGLSKIYKFKSCHIASDVFAVYLNGDKEILDSFVDELQNGISDLSDLFDIILSVGVCKVSKDVSVHYMIDCCSLAENSIKKSYSKTYKLFTEELRDSAKLNLTRLKQVTESIRNKELEIRFRKVYDINKNIVVFDTGFFLNNTNVKLDENNLFTFLEKNGLIVRLNSTIAEYIYSVMNDKANINLINKSFVFYVSRYYLENDKLANELLAHIKKGSGENGRYVLALQASPFGNSEKVFEVIRKFKAENVKIMIDYSNCQAFDFTLIFRLNVDVIKLDCRVFKIYSIENQRILLDIVKMLISFKIKTLLAHIPENFVKEFEKLDNNEYIYYTLEEDTLEGQELKNL